MKLRTVAFLACWTLSGTGHSVILSAENQQPASLPVSTSKEPEQTKPAPHSDPVTSGVYHVGGSVTPPKLISSVEPKLSKKERKQMMTGKTVIQIIVETDGHVRDAHVIKSIVGPTANKDDETVPMLDQKALDAVSEYRFEPATLQGKPVPVLVNVEVNFQVY